MYREFLFFEYLWCRSSSCDGTLDIVGNTRAHPGVRVVVLVVVPQSTPAGQTRGGGIRTADLLRPRETVTETNLCQLRTTI